MKLTGKCKADFEKWYYDKYFQRFGYDVFTIFSQLDDSMLYGVYVDFFDSVGIDIYYHCDETIVMFKNGEELECPRVQFNTRTKARIKAIKKANEIYNNKL